MLLRGHHKALAYDDMPGFMAALRACEGIGARALEFTILTAARTGEAIGARWEEFDLEKGEWVIPAGRMKASKVHRVPLSPRALEIVQDMAVARTGPYVFAGHTGRPLSNMAMAATLRRMGRREITVHGFRSTFRDWAAEASSFPHEVCEMALAHTIANRAEAAYRRGDLFDKRRSLMVAWARWCEPKAGNVIQFKPGGVT